MTSDAGPPVGEVLRLVREEDSFLAVRAIQQIGPPVEVAARYRRLVRELYWKEKLLPQCVTLGRMAIHYLLLQAEASADDEISSSLTGAAKGLAYDMASFCWPGWDEPDIVVTPAEFSAGGDAARLNFRLAVELKRDSGPLSNGHWMLGAYALASGRHAEAISRFHRAAQFATSAAKPDAALMCEGYIALAELLAHDTTAEARLAEVTQDLRAHASDDGPAFAEQILTAQRVFSSGTYFWRVD